MAIHLNILPASGSINFGNVLDGQSQTQNITLTALNTNTGVAIGTISGSTSPFSVSPSSFNLEPGETQVIVVTFAPVTVASFSDTLTISGNGDFSGTHINLSGNGIAATYYTSVDPASRNFGSVAIGLTKVQIFTFTADAGNSGSMNVTIDVSGIAAPFSITAGTLSFSLAPGASASLTVQYAPTAAGSFSGTLGISSSTAGAVFNTSTIPLSTTSFINSYSLPDTITAAGLMKTKLYVDPTLPPLTIPSGAWIHSIGKIKESVDVNPTEVDVQNVDIEVVEDYSVYPEGFWNKVINGYPTKNVVSSGTFAEPQIPASSPPASRTIVRTSGSFIDDGWKTNMTGNLIQAGANNGLGFTVWSVTDLVLTTFETFSVVTATSCTLINNMPCDVQLMFTLMNGSNEEYLFRGSIYKGETTALEYFRDGVNSVKGMKIQFSSMLPASQSIAVSQIDAVSLPTTNVTSESNFAWMATFGDLFKTMLSLAYGSNTAFINNSSDMLFASALSSPTFKQFTDLYFTAFQGYIDGGSGIHFNYGFLQSYAIDVGVLGAQNQESWNSRFATCKDLLQYLCLMFGVVPSYSFGNEDGYIDADPANNLHRITLNSRGQNTQVTMAGDIKSKGSEYLSASPAKTSQVRFGQTATGYTANFAAFFNGIFYANQNGVTPAQVLPSNAKFDIDSTVDFVGLDASTEIGRLQLFTSAVYPISGLGSYAVDSVKWWNYLSKQYDPSVTTDFFTAITKYYYYRFSLDRLQITRTYNSIKATIGGLTSQLNLKTLVGHTITDLSNDVIKSNLYYATDVEKDVMASEATVMWVAQ